MNSAKFKFFIFFIFVFPVYLIAQKTPTLNLGSVILNKHTFMVFSVNSPADAERLEQSLLSNEGILYAKSGYPEKTCTVVATEKIEDSFIGSVCNKIKNKTDKFNLEKIKVLDLLNREATEHEHFQQKCNSGNKELDAYIENYLLDTKSKK